MNNIEQDHTTYIEIARLKDQILFLRDEYQKLRDEVHTLSIDLSSCHHNYGGAVTDLQEDVDRLIQEVKIGLTPRTSKSDIVMSIMLCVSIILFLYVNS